MLSLIIKLSEIIVTKKDIMKDQHRQQNTKNKIIEKILIVYKNF